MPRKKMGALLAEHAEDVALVTGAVALTAGVGVVLGVGYALITAGVLLVAYGVWITKRR